MLAVPSPNSIEELFKTKFINAKRCSSSKLFVNYYHAPFVLIVNINCLFSVDSPQCSNTRVTDISASKVSQMLEVKNSFIFAQDFGLPSTQRHDICTKLRVSWFNVSFTNFCRHWKPLFTTLNMILFKPVVFEFLFLTKFSNTSEFYQTQGPFVRESNELVAKISYCDKKYLLLTDIGQSWKFCRQSCTPNAHENWLNSKAMARAELKGRGPGAIFTGGPYDVIHDVIVCKSYVFADSQGFRLFFPVVENVPTQMHIQLAARSKYWSVFLLRKNIS